MRRSGRLRRALAWPRLMLLFGFALAGVSIAWGVSTAISAGDGGDVRAGPTTTTVASGVLEQRRALEAYEEAVEEVAYEAGRVVVEGLRAGLGELSRNEVDDFAPFTERAESWANQLRNLKADLAAIESPAFLEEAHRIRLRAMDDYVAVARLLRRAGEAQGEERERLLDEVAAAGNAADDVWEEADAVVDEHRRRLGLPVTTLPGDVVEPEG